MNWAHTEPQSGTHRRLLIAIFLVLSAFFRADTAIAQDDPPDTIQSSESSEETTASQMETYKGSVARGAPAIFSLSDLKDGDILTINVSATSGDLDPFLALLGADADVKQIGTAYDRQVAFAIESGEDPFQLIPEFSDENFLAWDDDGGDGYSASLQFEVPTDGDYQLVVLSAPYARTSGDFDLQVGANLPEILPAVALESVNDQTLATYDPRVKQTPPISQEITGTVSTTDASTFFVLRDVLAGDSIYVSAEATDGDLMPVVFLEDYGGKPLAVANPFGEDPSAGFEYTFPADGSNYQLSIRSADTDPKTFGDYRVLVSLNDPGVLTGNPESVAGAVLKEPIKVKIGMKMDQITGVDQKSENFGAVIDARMEWVDPRLAFSPDSCQCSFQTYTVGAFSTMVSEKNAEWPEYTIFNQQGRRDSQSPTVAVQSDGHVIYLERFTATLQAPDFNFRKFPFDTQEFFIRFRAIFPEEFFVYEPLPGYSRLGDQLGEEEWVIEDAAVSVDTQESRSRFNFRFTAYRQLSFYIFRILVPVMLIIAVSWITFFLQDYGRRIEVTSGNLLVFIAFNFTVSDDLPRLGYLTFMDTILISTFIVSALVIVLNVYLKRLEVKGRTETARRIDRIVIWFYPLAFLIGALVVTVLFFPGLFLSVFTRG